MRAGRLTAEDIGRVFLSSPACYTRGEFAEAANVSEDLAGRIWRALGFATLADDALTFSDGDVTALRRIGAMVDEEELDEKIVVRMARALGQTTARLAQWQAEILSAAMLDPREQPTGDDLVGVLELAGRLMPDFESVLVHVWRTQLAAAANRLLAIDLTEEMLPGKVTLAVGFADLVAFTRFSRDLDEMALAELVEGFESRASDLIAARGGRLVKALGDEVLFTAPDARTAADIALDLVDVIGDDEGGPDLRIGLAYGPILPTMGDVFGTTVNLASRLTTIARPGTIVIDPGMAEMLGSGQGMEVSKIRRRPARGFGVVQPYVLRRS